MNEKTLEKDVYKQNYSDFKIYLLQVMMKFKPFASDKSKGLDLVFKTL